MEEQHSVVSAAQDVDLSDEREQMQVMEEDLAEKAETLMRLQSALEKDVQRYHDLFELAPDAYVVTDSHGVIREVNQTASVLLNVAREFLNGKVLITFVAPEDHSAFWSHVNRLQHGLNRADWEMRLCPRNAARKEVVCGVVPAYAPNTQGLQLHWLIRDVTNQKQLERERNQAVALSEENVRQAAILEERNRMARELHDTLAQGFTGISMQLDVAEELLSTSPEEARFHLLRARDIARQSIVDARNAIRDLRSQEMTGCDLPTAMAQLCEQISHDSRTNVVCGVHGAPFVLPSEVEIDLFRIGQEAITNALRHAGARRITLDLTYRPAHVELAIHDDGRGFDPAHTKQGFGLQGMRERAERSGGRLTLQSSNATGTQIQVTIPKMPLAP
jgi:PAS domain S-box-containing protein